MNSATKYLLSEDTTEENGEATNAAFQSGETNLDDINLFTDMEEVEDNPIFKADSPGYAKRSDIADTIEISILACEGHVSDDIHVDTDELSTVPEALSRAPAGDANIVIETPDKSLVYETKDRGSASPPASSPAELDEDLSMGDTADVQLEIMEHSAVSPSHEPEVFVFSSAKDDMEDDEDEWDVFGSSDQRPATASIAAPVQTTSQPTTNPVPPTSTQLITSVTTGTPQLTTSPVQTIPTQPAASPVLTTPTQPAASSVLATSTQPAPSSVLATPTQPAASPVQTTPTQPAASPIQTTPTQPAASPVQTTPAQPAASPVLTTPTQPVSSPILTTPTQPAASPVLTTPTQPAASLIITTSTQPSMSPVLITPTQHAASSVQTMPRQTTAILTLATPTQPAASSALATPTQPAASSVLATPTQPAASPVQTTPTQPAASPIQTTPTQPAASPAQTTPTQPAAGPVLTTLTQPAASPALTTPNQPAASSVQTMPTQTTAILTLATTTQPVARTPLAMSVGGPLLSSPTQPAENSVPAIQTAKNSLATDAAKNHVSPDDTLLHTGDGDAISSDDNEEHRVGALASEDLWDAVTASKTPQVEGLHAGSTKRILASEVISHFSSHPELQYHKRTIVPVIQYSGFRSCLAKLFGPPSLRTDLLPDRDLIFAMAASDCMVVLGSFENSDSVHVRMLQTLYKNVTGRPTDVPRYGNHWDDIGFQGTDPATDLRGGGCLGLLNLIYLTQTYPILAKDIYTLSQDVNQNFPFSVMGLNITRISLQVMRAQLLNKLANSTRDIIMTLNDFYSGCYCYLYTLWRDGGKCIADSGYVVKDTETFCKKNPDQVLKILHSYKASKGSPKQARKGNQSSNIGGFTQMDELEKHLGS